MASSPEMLILDEPTSELDGRPRRELAFLLHYLNGTLLVASHDLEFLKGIAKRVTALNEVKLARNFSAGKFFQNKELDLT